jgi:hypothetical protein
VAAGALLCAIVCPTVTHSSPAHGSAFTVLIGPAGPLQPPAAALQPIGAAGSGSRPMGLVRAPHAAFSAHFASRMAVNAASLPASADLTQYNPSVGDQGQVGSCAAWATGYYLRGWYAIRDGYYPPAGSGPGAGFAPMFLYSRSSGGVDNGSSIEYNLAIMQQGASGMAGYGQGIDTRADYTQGDFDYKDLPTAAEIANAAHYKIKSYAVYDPTSTGLNLEDWIKTTIAGGSPVVLGIPVYNNFYYATSSSYLVGVPAAGSTLFGYHAIFGDKYDANGVWIENQWGTWWGLNGWVELGWDFINWLYTNSSVWYDADAMAPLPAASGTATPTATSSPTGAVTSTSTPTATSTQSVAPTSTRTATTTPRSTSTATPRPTSTATRTATPRPTSTPHKRHP